MRKTAGVAFSLFFLFYIFPLPSTLLAATISIDANQIMGPVNQLVFGNAQDHGHGDLLLESSSWSFVPQALDLVSALRPTVLRFPGGSRADEYFWEDGIGPHYLRPEPRSGQWESFGFDYGTDEHMALCEEVGAEAFFTVNYGSGILEDSLSIAAPLSQRVNRAADWVEYCNALNDGSNPNGGVDWAARRVANGHPEPYGIRFWEIGNEIYGQHETGHVDVETYAQDVICFSQAMKGVDPAIKIGAVGVPFPHWQQWWNNSPLEWNATVLQIAKWHIDFLVVHCQYPGVTTVSGEPLYWAGMAGANQALTDLSELRRIINQEAGPSIGIVPGENTFFCGVQQWELSTSLLAGLHCADLLMLFLEQSRALNINFACSWKLHAPTPNADIVYRTSPEQRYASPEYFSQLVFREHFGDTLVANSLDCGTFSNQKVAQIQNMSAVPELSVCTSLDSTGTKLYLMVINKQLDQDVTTTIQLEGFEPQPEACVWTLNGPSIISNNEDNPNTVCVTPSTLAPVSSSFIYTFPAHSLTAIELSGSGRDSSAPTIFDVQITEYSGFSAIVSWQTDKPSDSKIEYGSAPGDYLCAVEDPLLTTQHQLCLEPLQSETMYYIRVGSCDSRGNMALSWEDTLWTPDVTPPLMNQVEVVAITETTATICWLTDEPADSRVECWYADGSFPTLLGTTFAEEHAIALGNLQPATTYSFQVSGADSAGNVSRPVQESFITTSPRSAADGPGSSDPMPSNYKLWQNFPNPFNGSTNIRYNLPQGTFVLVKVYNLLGQLVKTLVQERQMLGEYQLSWDARDDWGREVASGVYFCCLQTSEFKQIRKMILLR